MIVAGLLCAVVAASLEPRYVVVPDKGTFVHGFTLRDDERLHLIPCGRIIRADGYPDIEKIKAAIAHA